MPALITVTRYYSLPAAVVAGSVLNHAGIPCFVFDRQIAGQYAFTVVGIGGVRVAVPAAHAAEAREILDIADDLSPNGDAEDCPHCGASGSFRPASLIAGVLVFLYIGNLFLLWGRRRLCRQCGRKWRMPR